MLPQDAAFPAPEHNQTPARRAAAPVAGRIEPVDMQPPEGPPPPGLSSGPDLPALLRGLRRRWAAAILLGGTLAAAAAVAAWFLLSAKYTAFARLRIAVKEYEILRGTKGGDRGDFVIYLKTQAAQLTSRPVLWAALKRDEVKRLNLESHMTDPITTIEENLKVEVQENSEVVTLLFSDPDPVVANTIVKAIVAAYMEEIVYAENNTRVKRVTDLEKVYNEAQEGLKGKKDSLKRLTDSLGGKDPISVANRKAEIMNNLRDAKQEERLYRFETLKAEALLKAHDTRVKALRKSALSEAAIDNALRTDAEGREIQANIKKNQTIVDHYKRTSDFADEPGRVQAERRIVVLKKELAEHRKELRAELKKRLDTGMREEQDLTRAQLVNTVQSLKELYDKAKAEAKEHALALSKIGPGASEWETLVEEIKRDDLAVADIGKELNRERIELRAASRISVAQDAELQKKDMKKQVLATVAAPVVVLFAVCVGLAWGDHRQRRIRTADEIASGLGIPVVGAIPSVPNLERHLVGPSGEPELEGHPVLESIDAIRTLLLRAASADTMRTVMVTSATTGEGKTTLAAHLASSLARAGRKTLLIDGDLRGPSAHQLFELPVQPGFSEVLLGEVEMEDAVQPTTLDNLSLIAAGQWDREVMQALARDGLEGIVEKLQEEFDFVVIDSHPVLPATDSLLIGQHVDAVILSVLREVSQMPRVYAASQRLTALGIRVLGAVVNGTDPEEIVHAPSRARMAAQ